MQNGQAVFFNIHRQVLSPDHVARQATEAERKLHKTLYSITNSSMDTRATVCIALTMAVLNDLKVKAADVLNAYMMTPNRKNMDRIRPRV